MPHIPDHSDAELDTIRTLLKQRYKEHIEIHLADAEVRLTPDSDQLTECPTAYWYARECNFVIVKSGPSEYRCQFFYDPRDQFGTGHALYTRLEECAAALLQVQSDHEREREDVTSGTTGSEIH